MVQSQVFAPEPFVPADFAAALVAAGFFALSAALPAEVFVDPLDAFAVPDGLRALVDRAPLDFAADRVGAAFLALSAALPAEVEALVDLLAPLDRAAAAAFVLRDGFAAGAFVALAGGFEDFFAVADLWPPGEPGFGAPTVAGAPEGRRADPGVDLAAGVPGVSGAASFLSSRKRLASSVPRVTASRPSSTAVSMMLFGLSAMRAFSPARAAATRRGPWRASPRRRHRQWRALLTRRCS
jgi:hypothetical protein